MRTFGVSNSGACEGRKGGKLNRARTGVANELIRPFGLNKLALIKSVLTEGPLVTLVNCINR